MAKSQTETHTHLATPEFLHRREASTYKDKKIKKINKVFSFKFPLDLKPG